MSSTVTHLHEISALFGIWANLLSNHCFFGHGSFAVCCKEAASPQDADPYHRSGITNPTLSSYRRPISRYYVVQVACSSIAERTEHDSKPLCPAPPPRFPPRLRLRPHPGDMGERRCSQPRSHERGRGGYIVPLRGAAGGILSQPYLHDV